ncbi:MAG: hypothetical protein NZ839_00915 [Endomicrobia bacterium]|nr:hypothetical protein [Endomicrobiia bacterium]
MAIDSVKKAIIFVPNDIFEKFIVELKLLSAVEIISQEEKFTSKQVLFGLTLGEAKNCIAKIDTTLNILSKYPSLTQIKSKTDYNIHIINQQVRSMLFSCVDICEKIEQIDAEIKTCQNQLHQLNLQYDLISQFSTLNVNFNLLRKIKTLNFYFVRINSKFEKQFLNEISKIDVVSILWENKVKDVIFMCIAVEKEKVEMFLNITKKYEITFYDMINLISKDTPSQQLEFLSQEIVSYKHKTETLLAELQSIYNEKKDFISQCYMLCLELVDFFDANSSANNTQFIKIITCWVPNKHLSKLKYLRDKFKEISILLFDPGKNEDVPTVLSNKQISEPYEFITTLYGYPKLNTVDPTELLAPFFTLFFALCLSDIFYGLLLVVLWLGLKDKISKTSDYYKFITLFKYLGISSVIIGIFLDSFLGISIFKNFKFPVNLTLFDPLNRPIDMLKFTFLLGLVQIIFGLMVSAVKSFKDRDLLSGIDNLSWVLFIIIFAPVVYKLFFPKDVSQKLVNLSMKWGFFLFLFIVIFQSREIKPIFLKPLNFFIKAYNTIGFYADILSYSRILALALASAAIAQTINILVSKLFSASLLGIKFVEPLLAPIVFIGGHIFNFLMSVLGGLVHSARLQYLEFFSKFFIGGGRPIKLFSPLKR